MGERVEIRKGKKMNTTTESRITITISEEEQKTLIDKSGNHDPSYLVELLEEEGLELWPSGVDGWTYVLTEDHSIVYELDDYHFNGLNELVKNGKTTLKGLANNETYEGYEWNEEDL